MEANTINRVIQTGKVDEVRIIPTKIGTETRLMGVMYIKQWDYRKKEEEEVKRINEFVVKGVGASVKAFQEIERLLKDKQTVYVAVRGALQSRVLKESSNPALTVLTNIFVVDYDAIDLIPDFILVNEVSFAGRIFQNDSIRTKIKYGSRADPDSVRVEFAMQVGKTQESQNPFSTTKPSNVFFCVYKPKDKESFEQVKARFIDTGRSIFLVGALISKYVRINEKEVYRLEVLIRQVKISAGRHIITEEKEVANVYSK
jgi:hypothetical protein